MTTQNDEIVAEIRRHREAHAASLDYDLKRITQDFQEQERGSRRKIVRREPRAPVTVPRPTSV